MTDQLDRRVDLLARMDTALARRTTRTEHELSAIANELDALGRSSTDEVDLLELNQRFGRTLFVLSDGSDHALATAAARHLGTALALARKHRPDGVAEIKLDLFRAEHAVVTLDAQSRQVHDRERAEAAA